MAARRSKKMTDFAEFNKQVKEMFNLWMEHWEEGCDGCLNDRYEGSGFEDWVKEQTGFCSNEEEG